MNDRGANEAGDCRQDSRSWDLYKLLIQEQQNMHNRWIDNFRVILTFNSILLPGSVAIFLLLARKDVSCQAREAAPIMLATLSVIGILVTLIGAALVDRVSSIGTLRHNEIRHIEDKLQESLWIRPFYEGQWLPTREGGKLLATRADGLDSVRKPRLGRFSGYHSYMFLSAVFVIAYILLFVLSMQVL